MENHEAGDCYIEGPMKSPTVLRKLDAADHRAVRALVDAIGRLSDTPILDTLTAELPSLLGAEMGGAYRIGLDGPSWHLDFFHGSGFPPNFGATFAQFAAASPSTAMTNGYDALRPPRTQRNVAVDPIALVGREAVPKLPMTRHVLGPHKVDRHNQLRVLVCDGPHLLAWVGVLRRETFGARERGMLGAIARPLVGRLLLDRRLRDQEVRAKGFDAALEALSVAAFLVHGQHTLVHANAIGRALLDSGSIDVPARMRAGRLGVDPTVTVIPLTGRSLESYTLVVIAQPAPGLELRIERAARAWGLTARHRDVLRCLVLGEANKTIAERLGLSVVTVEVHVSAILRKARVDSRAELVARFWTLT
jgi:DNA-binding CsgD family transcriptional regulator